MSEWWTYRLSDFLLFSARTYYRLFELYNRDIWPAQLATLALGVVILACLLRRDAWRGRLVAAILAGCWLWVAWAFQLERYASINWAASAFAIGFAAEALLLVWFGIVRDDLLRAPSGRAHVAGVCMVLFALAVQPVLGPMTGRPWAQAEVFGTAPDPTAVATLGVLLLAPAWPRWALMPIPLAWCVISGATLWAMASPEALLMPLAALLVLLLSLRKAG